MNRQVIMECLDELEDLCEGYAGIIVDQMKLLGCDIEEAEIVADAELSPARIAIERLKQELDIRPRREQPHRFGDPL